MFYLIVKRLLKDFLCNFVILKMAGGLMRRNEKRQRKREGKSCQKK